MRILHVVESLNRGGAETWLTQVLHHIDRQKYQMDFLVHINEAGAYDEEVTALGARIFACLAPANPLRYALNFRRILRKYGPYDCVHSHVHHYSGYALMLAAMHQVPLRIAHCHSDTCSIDNNSPFLRKAYLSGMEALIRHFATAGISVSESAARALFSESWRSDPRWSLCPLGIDLRPFYHSIDSYQVRRELGISQDAFVIGHVGRFVEVKNHRFLVEIAERICKLESKAVFLLIGEGPLKPEIEALVHARGLSRHFIFAGGRPDIPKLLKGAMDCFLFPSVYEGLPLALLEAQAAGLYCVVSDSVSDEGDIAEDAITRISLATSPDTWAAQILNARSKPASFTIPERWSKTRSIEASAERIQRLYDLGEIQAYNQ